MLVLVIGIYLTLVMPVLAWGVSHTFILLVQFSEKFLLHSSCSFSGFKSFCYTPDASFSSVRNFPYTPEASFNQVFRFYSSCSVGLVVSRVCLTFLQFSWQFQCGRVSLSLLMLVKFWGGVSLTLLVLSDFSEEFCFTPLVFCVFLWGFSLTLLMPTNGEFLL